jgi:hypothetical protein
MNRDGVAVAGINKTVLPVVMEPNLPVPGFDVGD